jgi:iron complex transport system substrate-binding protein
MRRSPADEVVYPEELVASVSPPTALSLTWGLDDYVALLSEAVTSAS